MVILKKNLGSEVDSEDIMKKDLATVISARMARMITEIECLGEFGHCSSLWLLFIWLLFINIFK